MNKKGSGMFVVIMAFMIFMAGMVFMNFITPEVTTARTAMDCTNSTISDGAKVTCLGVYLVAPYIILIIISAAGGIIIDKIVT